MSGGFQSGAISCITARRRSLLWWRECCTECAIKRWRTGRRSSPIDRSLTARRGVQRLIRFDVLFDAGLGWQPLGRSGGIGEAADCQRGRADNPLHVGVVDFLPVVARPMIVGEYVGDQHCDRRYACFGERAVVAQVEEGIAVFLVA